MRDTITAEIDLLRDQIESHWRSRLTAAFNDGRSAISAEIDKIKVETGVTLSYYPFGAAAGVTDAKLEEVVTRKRNARLAPPRTLEWPHPAMAEVFYADAVQRLAAERQRAEKAEAEVKRPREALGYIENIQPMFEGGMGISTFNLQNTLEEARQIARDALRGEGEERE